MSLSVPIGRDIFTGDIVLFRESPEGSGVYILAAKSRYGKTCTMMTIVVGLANYTDRPILILSYSKEWEVIDLVNWDSRDNYGAVGDLIVLRRSNFGFLISDFSSPVDWEYLAFPEGSSRELSLLAKFDRAHRNNVNIFYDMLLDLPTQDKNILDFSEKWGVPWQRAVHSELKRSILSRFNWLMYLNVFLDPTNYLDQDDWDELSREEKLEFKGKVHITNFGKLLFNNRHLCINLQIDEIGGNQFAQFLVGKIMEQLLPYLERLKPYLVFEEADALFPRDPPTMPRSLASGIKYSNKMLKAGIAMFMIAQNPYSLNPQVRQNEHTLIYGQLAKEASGAFLWEETQKLLWDRESGLNQFLIYSHDRLGSHRIFNPLDAPCQYRA